MIKLSSVTRTELEKDKNFYKNLGMKMTIWVYLDSYLLDKYGMGLCSYITKNLEIKVGYFKTEIITSKINFIDIGTNTELAPRQYGNDWAKLIFGKSHPVKFREDLHIIESAYGDKLTELEQIAKNHIEEIIDKVNQKQYEKEIEEQERIRKEEASKPKDNAVVFRMGGSGYYRLTFEMKEAMLEQVDNQYIVCQNKLGIDSKDRLINIMHQYLELYGFNTKEHIETILEDCEMLNNVPSIVRLMLILTDNINVVKGRDFGVKTEAFSNLKLPLKINLVQLSSELSKITRGENTKVTLPGKLHRYPFLKEADYLADRAHGSSSGNTIVFQVLLRTGKLTLDEVKKLVKRDIKNIIKECYRSAATGQIQIYGNHAPLNMYKVKSYKLVDRIQLNITLQLKINDTSIEVIDTLDNLVNPYDKEKKNG